MLNLREAIVQAIEAERGVRRWSVRELAERSEMPPPTLRNYLELPREIPVSYLAAIAGAFGWRTSDLVKEAERRIDAETERES